MAMIDRDDLGLQGSDCQCCDVVDHVALEQLIRERDEMVEAIKGFLDHYYIADRDGDRPSWPRDLEDMVDWSIKGVDERVYGE